MLRLKFRETLMGVEEWRELGIEPTGAEVGATHRG
jgi:hypothetical protein